MNQYKGRRQIGPVFFSWQYTGSADDRVEVRWRDSIIVEESLPPPPGRNPLTFSVEDPSDNRRRVSGVLKFDSRPTKLVVNDFNYPDAANGSDCHVDQVVLFPDAPPQPTPPAPDYGASEDALLVERSPESDLFPYLYLAQWPDISAAELADRFVQYDPGSAPEDSLYRQLLAARAEGRDAMLEQADFFLAGRPPYSGRYLRDIAVLGAPMNRLSHLDMEFRTDPPASLGAFKQRTEAALDMVDWECIVEYWQGEAYARLSQRCWQNLFALSVQPGFNRQLADQLLRTLALAGLIGRIVDGEDRPAAWPAARLQAGIEATTVLPGTLFPMPPAESGQGGGDFAAPVPYAIGDLELVRQRLCRYELGEVSGIENVMRGEYKESSLRSLRESRVEELASEESSDSYSSEFAGQRRDLLAETLNTLKENFQYHYESQYGPPAKQLTVIVDGRVEPVDDQPQKVAADEVAGSARSLTQRAASSLARRVHWQRSSASLNRDESHTLRRVDASQMEANVRAVYRWVNKIYQCWTVALGRRFVLEFFVREPARGYIAGAFSLRGLSLREPPPLVDFGVETFLDISTDPESPSYYARLAAEYQVVDLQPPPPRDSRSSASFQWGDPVSWQPLPVEPGYGATSAKVSVSPGPGSDNLQLSIAVGQRRCQYPGGEEESLQLDGETDRVPAAVVAAANSGAYSVAVEVKAELTAEALDRWKLETYRAIAAGCEQQRQRYYDTLSGWPGDRKKSSALGARETVREELRRDIVRQLLREVDALTGERGDLALGEERYVQFFQRALAWDEMAYAFTVKTENDLGSAIGQQYRGEDELFSAFLQAGFSRVLLPVTPEFSYRMLYFLASGQIWPGADALAPTFCPERESEPDYRYINLVNALKEAAREPQGKAPAERWELVVPTEMTVLQESGELPVFKGSEA